MTTTVNSSMLHSTKFQKMFVAFFGTQLRRYIYIYIYIYISVNAQLSDKWHVWLIL